MSPTQPLDPATPKGRRLEIELTELLANIELRIAEREAAARRASRDAAAAEVPDP
jgi:hypothetical protein